MKTIDDYKDFGEFVEDFREMMAAGGGRFLYKKKDGSLRMAVGSARSKDGYRAQNDRLYCYWDEEAENYRSFYKANLLGICK
jgi:hypothetical protein